MQVNLDNKVGSSWRIYADRGGTFTDVVADYSTRMVLQNIHDLKAQVAANRRGTHLMELIQESGTPYLDEYSWSLRGK